MKPEDLPRVEELYHAALALAPDERAAYLNRNCADDEMRREVESLLGWQPRADEFIETQALTMAADLLARERQPIAPGLALGAYRLERELGAGGMGAVWLAARADDAYRKRVAIKLIKRGMDTRDILDRFRHERQILAALDHPHIARLLDGGSTPDGLPYFVMEYIDGAPLDEYCDSHRLTTEARLKLFLKVCDAVQFAHRNLVVHRDLKPGNILVTTEGEPKLLDFGIARVLNPDLFALSPRATLTGLRPMTPAYASPEQVQGRPITTASDVYSLGVILYELLTGRRPYEITSASPKEIERVVCEVEPERPSTAVLRATTAGGAERATAPQSPEAISRRREASPDKLQRRLRGDLDNIVLMALRKEPERRYASVEQLAADIRRHLDGRPVLAHRPTLGYRALKFARRNRLAVGAAAVIAVLLVAFVATTLAQAHRLARARDRAEQERDHAAKERDKAAQVAQFLLDVFRVSDPNEARGNQVTARELLDRGAEKVRNELKDQPDVQAAMMLNIGRVYDRLGLFDRAEPLLEEALRMRRQLNDQAGVADSLEGLQELYFIKRESPEKAEALCREALAIRRRLFPGDDLRIAESLDDLAGFVASGRHDLTEAEALRREALAMRLRLVGHDHTDVAASFNNLGNLLTEKGDLAGAEAALRESLSIYRRLRPADHPDLAAAINNLSAVLGRRRDYAAAAALDREATAIARKALGDEHPDTVLYLSNLAVDLLNQEKYAEAAPLFRQTLAAGRKLYPAGHTEIARMAVGLGRCLVELGEAVEAEPLLREGVEIYRRARGAESPATAGAESALGRCLTRRGHYAEAEALLPGAYARLKEKRGDQDPTTQRALRNLVALYEAEGHPERAAPYRTALAAK